MNPINVLFKVLYWPICRAYTRLLGDRPADALLRFLCSPQFWRVNRFWPDFVHPQRFSEKVWSFQLHNRDPKLTMISDNFRVRDYVTQKVGSEYLVPMIWNGAKQEEIPFDDLPLKFVIKTNHGCGYNIFVKNKMKIDIEKTKRQLKEWMNTNFCHDTALGIAWAYRNIKPHIIIETFLEENHKVPVDYKFWCFSGRVETISLHFDRFENHATIGLDRNFEPGGICFNLPHYNGDYKRPSNYKEMVRVAEILADKYEFLRVDLYNVGGKIYFSELTPYPGGVSARFEPESMDYFFGEKWKNSTLYVK